MKSVRLRIAAKLLWVFGLLACLIGCGVYAILCLPEVLNLPFEPLYLAAAGILAILIWIIAIILSAASKSAARAEEMEARLLEEAALAAVEEQEMEIVPEDEEVAVEVAAPKSLTEKVLAKMHLKPEALTLAKKAAVVVVPVVATCVVASAMSKAKKKKQQAKNRQAFYRWLG
ncbi:MAG: hypothetical protein IJX62_05925 [Clostridia bacterium]|nr:hypothetical protein [Clostridia bacterium]